MAPTIDMVTAIEALLTTSRWSMSMVLTAETVRPVVIIRCSGNLEKEPYLVDGRKIYRSE